MSHTSCEESPLSEDKQVLVFSIKDSVVETKYGVVIGERKK